MAISREVREFVEAWPVYAKDLNDPTFLSRPQVDTLQADLLAAQILRLAKVSPYYGKLLKGEKALLSHVRKRGAVDRELLQEFPLTRREDYQADPEAFRLKLNSKDDVYNTLWGLVHTSGTTTGTPTPFYDTSFDMFAQWMMLRRLCKIAMIAPTDMNVSFMPVPPIVHNAFVASRDACTSIGAPYVGVFLGRQPPEFEIYSGTDEALRLAEGVGATVIWGLSSYMRYALRRARELEIRLPKLRLIWALGEPCPGAMRESFHRTAAALGADNVVVNNGLGFTEMRGTMAECFELGGCHNPSPDLYLFEIVDPRTGKSLPEGEVGHLALTHLQRRGTAFVRYLTGDLAKISCDPCPLCGRAGERVLVGPGGTYATRTTEWVKFKGVLLHPATVLEELSGIRGLEEFQVVLSKSDLTDPFSLDELIVRASVSNSYRGKKSQLEQLINERVVKIAEIRPKVEWVETDTIYNPRESIKARRVVDERPSTYGVD